MDPVFVNNYEVDPTLSWQFFGSSTGFLRRFPGRKLYISFYLLFIIVTFKSYGYKRQIIARNCTFLHKIE